jgi:hypothetical protein
VANTITSRQPGGGTPTAAALTMLGTTPDLTANDNRADYVVLITDGLPNCNTNNPAQLCSCNQSVCGAGCTAPCPAQVAQCACTQGSAASACSAPSVCSIGCLDAASTISTLNLLNTIGIKTFVVGLGADVSTSAAGAVIDGMARAGGVPRKCPNGTLAECGGGACGANGICERAFYEVRSAAELNSALNAIYQVIRP